ncbi:basic proline-rich protein-like [Pristis pectinata]|uniref:basic proline-rich protein-like n=1 Tax=Pristis pectinata TaxID=685728 RepID=UPI00223CCCDF|nr:basic proline-rich protein-like [Pristis pectinata]
MTSGEGGGSLGWRGRSGRADVSRAPSTPRLKPVGGSRADVTGLKPRPPVQATWWPPGENRARDWSGLPLRHQRLLGLGVVSSPGDSIDGTVGHRPPPRSSSPAPSLGPPTFSVLRPRLPLGPPSLLVLRPRLPLGPPAPPPPSVLQPRLLPRSPRRPWSSGPASPSVLLPRSSGPASPSVLQPRLLPRSSGPASTSVLQPPRSSSHLGPPAPPPPRSSGFASSLGPPAPPPPTSVTRTEVRLAAAPFPLGWWSGVWSPPTHPTPTPSSPTEAPRGALPAGRVPIHPPSPRTG